MTPSPPDEALHFRGKTLTPESPRPLHIPEPSNIPVLENQMDPVFNDTSTYERSVYKQVPQIHDGWLHGGLKDGGGQSQTQDAGSFHGSQPNRGMQNEMIASAYYPPNPASGSENPSHQSSGFSHPDSTYSLAAPDAPVSQAFATGSEVDHAHNPEQSRMPDRLIAEERGGHTTGGVNFQQLLDNLSHPNPGATIPAVSSAENSSLHQAPAGESLKSQGIPAHLQAQSHDSIQAHYTPNVEVAYHQLPSAHDAAATASPAYSAQPSNIQPQTQSQPFNIASGEVSAVNNLLPPISTYPKPPSTGAESQGSLQEPLLASKKGRVDKQGRPIKLSDDDMPWGPEVQKKYDEFLHDERIYVTEGLWDRFPMGSRLFVGNLPTERVTKRDMFHIFHKYGKLAQISIKQAYGFIQFLEASSCHAALGVEQGAVILKFQSLNDLPDPLKHPKLPVHRRHVVPGHRSSAVPVLAELTSEPQSTDTTGLSPMKQVGFHSAISGMNLLIAADATIIARHDRLPHDLFGDLEMGIGRATEARKDLIAASEGAPVLHVLLALLIPETDVTAATAQDPVRDVPDVQILVLEELDRNFVLHVENAFRNRGLRVDVLVLGPRIPLGAAVHRQFIEGVLAVVRLARPNQVSRKIPLQLFDRTAGLDNVRFLDYPELEPNMSAELLSHQSQAMQRGAAPAAFAPNPGFILPPAQPMAVPPPGLPALSNPPNIANLIGSLDGPSLSTLLSALQRPPHSQPVSATQSPFSSPNPPPADLASLLTNAHRAPPMQTTAQQPLPHPPFNLQPVNAPVITDPTLLSLLAKGLGGQQQQSQGPVGPQVQNLMQHLAKWKQ
ncbi:Nucleotide-binding, alpha-beta plait [Penicillium expansum]|uniref:Nucleotide-binding, alpha-beta plait n=1 Tax=Penicillium expansum TaxID=27334 RepID=A0A0A2K8S6_PENEN|nr:Nucleotide-binding, alpha-beta plait [Penicillium expansum]KGO42194.1 Nucleotide-binding, alpha-beta plait [Penicillium expansum]KGO56235.1 Nucleotide-binding, alpha-beta plait [Penicillium expansum]KGO64237.1 Nucleotide-binding, alpha-beta plait [Penicillium expansum]